MRWARIAAIGTVVVSGLAAGSAPTGAASSSSAVRTVFAAATFGDPTACGEGRTCDALYLTAVSGVVRTGSERLPVPGLLLVQVIASTVSNGSLVPVGDIKMMACTTDVAVRLVANLGSGRADTFGRVPLRNFTGNADGTFTCDTPNGHWLELSAAWTGNGEMQKRASKSQQADPWMRQLQLSTEWSRPAAADAAVTLDDSSFSGAAAPDSAFMVSTASRSMVLDHGRQVGPAAQGPLVVRPGDVVVSSAQTEADGLWVEAVTFTRDGTTLKSSLVVFGTWADESVWSMGYAGTITIAPDVSGGGAAGTVALYREGTAGPERIGDASLSVTWIGVDKAWRFSAKGVGATPDGHGSYLTTGIHRDAAMDITLDGESRAGSVGYLEAVTTKTPPGQG
jgi:hypothetical protein